MSASNSRIRHPRTKIRTYSNAFRYMNEKVSVATKSHLDTHVPGLPHRLLHDADGGLTGVLPPTDLAPLRHNVGSDRGMLMLNLDEYHWLVLNLDEYHWTETEREDICTCDYL